MLPDPAFQNYAAVLEPSSLAHPLGTDQLGRDILSRLAQGARISLIVAIGSQVLALAAGVVIGGTAAMAGGRRGELLMRLTDAAFAFPALLFVIVLRAVVGGGLFWLTLTVAAITWPLYARLARAQIIAVLDEEFITAVHALGASPRRIMLTHALPNAWGALLVAAVFSVPQAVFLEAALGFLGLSIAPPAAN